MTRGSRIKSALLVAVFALAASSVIVTSAAVILGMAGRPLTAHMVLAAVLALAGAIVLLRDLIARAIVGLILGWFGERASDEDDLIDELSGDLEIIFDSIREAMREDLRLSSYGGPGEEDDEDLSAGTFLVWSLVERIRSKVAPWTRASIIVIHEQGIPLDAYPEDLAAELAVEGTDLGEDRSVAAGVDGDVIEVWLSRSVFNLLRREALQGEDAGEVFKVKTPKVANLLYIIAKEIYRALNPGAPEELAAYIAYKALLALEREGAIKLEAKPTISKLEKSDVWTSVRSQLEEEESLNTSGKKPGKA